MPASYGKYLLAFSCFIVTTACSLIARPSPEPTATPIMTDSLPTTIEQEDQVYALFFADFSGTTAVVRDDTFDDTYTQNEQETRDYILSNLSDVSNETLNSYIERNVVSSKLSATMNLGVDYILLSTPEFLEITSKSNWGEVLKETYPGSEGYVAFSRIGFNNSHTQALVYVTRVIAPLVGKGGYYLLEYNAGQWKIIGQFLNVNT